MFGLSADSQSGQLSQRILEWFFGPSILAPERLLPAQYVLRKMAHLTEFAILFGTALLAWRRVDRAWLYCVTFAMLDEWHQAWVPHRGASWLDVVVDSGGSSLAALLWLQMRRMGRGRGAQPGQDGVA